MAGLLDGCMAACLDGWMAAWLDGCMVAWLGGRLLAALSLRVPHNLLVGHFPGNAFAGWLDGWSWLAAWLVVRSSSSGSTSAWSPA